ncbi:MAG: sulfotransferase domain-containing protein [Betaproteobacteria bacterium]|nr:MAG: sulfotransferase domain-containing protein [Betaproteobacteria bacterium]
MGLNAAGRPSPRTCARFSWDPRGCWGSFIAVSASAIDSPMTPPEKVAFLVAGAQKGGTSALDAYLREHPELCLPREKELHFFDTDRFFAVEPVDYTPYHRSFDPASPQRLLGEVTPAYLYWPTAAERIARYNPAMKFIMVLRNPVTRAFSQWNMARQRKREPLTFLEALKAEPERVRTMPPELAKRFTYVDRGFYARQLERLWRHFPREQTIAFKSEELLGSPASVLGRIAESGRGENRARP